MNLKNKKVLLTGGSGFLGHFIKSELEKKGVGEISIPRSAKNDLRKWEECQKAVDGVDLVIHAAGNVGGIGYNQEFPGTLFYDNLMMGAQLMEAARQAEVEKFVAIGTICCYPKFCPIPFREENLWDGYPEETNAPYGLAKKMLLVQSQAYRSEFGFNSIFLLPVNLYGPGDNFDPKSSHVIPALIRKMHEAKVSNAASVTVWGTGKASREFLFVEDCAKAIVLASEKLEKSEPVNIGSGNEITIKDLVHLIAEVVGFEGEIVWDKTKPDGQPRRKLDVTRAKKEFGFSAKTEFETGLTKAYQWFLNETT